jgi:hypothetical protein
MGKMKELTLDEEFSKILTEVMTREMEHELLSSKELIVDDSWSKAPFNTSKFTWPFAPRLGEVVEWIHLNSTGRYRLIGQDFWFQNKKDLTAFILKWS